jgi:inorganic pyrophosphatase
MNLAALPHQLVDQLEEFLVSYNKSRGKKFKVMGVHGPSKAVKRVQQAIQAATQQTK